MKKYLSLLIPLLIFGCDPGSDPSPNQSLFISTDKVDYQRNEKTILTIYNHSDRVAVFQGCLSDVFYYRDRWVEDAWVEWTSLSCSDTVETFLILLPNTSFSDSVVVHKPGGYRFRIPLNWEETSGTPDMITSNSFTIHQQFSLNLISSQILSICYRRIASRCNVRRFFVFKNNTMVILLMNSPSF